MTAVSLGYSLPTLPVWQVGAASSRWAAQTLINVGWYGGRAVATGLMPAVTGVGIGFLAAAAMEYLYETYSEIQRLNEAAERFEPDPSRILATMAEQGLQEPSAILAADDTSFVDAMLSLNWDLGPSFVEMDTPFFETPVEGVRVSASAQGTQGVGPFGDRGLLFQWDEPWNAPPENRVIRYEDLQIGVGIAGEYPQRAAIPATTGTWLTQHGTDDFGRAYKEPWIWTPDTRGLAGAGVRTAAYDDYRPIAPGFGSARTLSDDKVDVLLPPIPVSVYLPGWVTTTGPFNPWYVPIEQVPAGSYPKDSAGNLLEGIAIGGLGTTDIPRLPEIPATSITVRPVAGGIQFLQSTKPAAQARPIDAVNTLQQDVKSTVGMAYLAALQMVNKTWGRVTEFLDVFKAFRDNVIIYPRGRPLQLYAESVKNRGFYYRVTITKPTRLGELPLNAQAEVLKRMGRTENMGWQLDIEGFARAVLMQEITDRLIAMSTAAERSMISNAPQFGMALNPLEVGNLQTWYRRSQGWLGG